MSSILAPLVKALPVELPPLAADVVSLLLLVAMIIIVILQIVFRYVLNDSLSWTEEVSKTMMVWTAFLVAPWAYRVGANVRIEIFVDEFPDVMRRLMALALNLLILWIVAVFLYESFGFWQRGQGALHTTWKLPSPKGSTAKGPSGRNNSQARSWARPRRATFAVRHPWR